MLQQPAWSLETHLKYLDDPKRRSQLRIDFSLRSPMSPANFTGDIIPSSSTLITNTTQQTLFRTTYSIVRSCAVTIVACTWTSLHPNILPRAALRRKLEYRVILFLIAILVPDFIVAWAMRQWIASREVTRLYEGMTLSFSCLSLMIAPDCPNWTQTHSRFAIMGGFLYKKNRKDDDDLGAIASPHRDPLKTLIQSGEVKITKAEINDKSKDDIVSKGLALLQTLWFVIPFFKTLHHAVGLVHQSTN
jgi:hypothetical protein